MRSRDPAWGKVLHGMWKFGAKLVYVSTRDTAVFSVSTVLSIFQLSFLVSNRDRLRCGHRLAAYIAMVEVAGRPVCFDFKWNVLPPTMAPVNNPSGLVPSPFPVDIKISSVSAHVDSLTCRGLFHEKFHVSRLSFSFVSLIVLDRCHQLSIYHTIKAISGSEEFEL